MTSHKNKSQEKETQENKSQKNKSQENKSWGGRFSASTDIFVEQFTQSVSYDQRLYHYDILGSIAHVSMLAKVGVLSREESDQIIEGLESIEADIVQGSFEWEIALEDVHMNIETALVTRIGDVGKKLHTGRSRNDQIATDIRLYLRDEVTEIQSLLVKLMSTLLDLAEREAETIMPGFTHMQTAQPVTFGHHMLAWFEMLYRDSQRLVDCHGRINVMPLGSAALAGTSYPIDRQYTAELLNFPAVTNNSLDAVSDRDFAIEFSSCAALIMMHLSRFSEELVIWMSQQFGFIDLGDAWCTGSSIMPQKKNPDIPELVRGKTARVYGHLMGLLTLMKSQPLAYNRDNQEDKESLFDVVDTVKACLHAYTGLVPEIIVNKDRMRSAAMKGFTTATDLADYLVRKNIAFRDAHTVVGQSVQYAIKVEKDLSELTLDELKQFSEVIEDDVFDFLSLEGSVAARAHQGGTAPEQVYQAIHAGRERLKFVPLIED
ncbi:MAG: argininosuccinate lyase, partial [Proteobacteria bacterium]|nr:argininosuccinate lyase [Pseudomonadota bacterium]